MVDNQIALIQDFLVGKNDINKEYAKLEKRVQRLGRLSAKGIIPRSAALQSIDGLKGASKEAGVLKKALVSTFDDASRAANGFKFEYLGIMFAGMALKRTFGGVLRSITNTFQKAENDQSALRQGTTKLTAAWEFFKFSLFDVLNTDVFIGIIDGAIKFINKISESKGVLTAILVGSVSLAAVGTALMTIGQIALGWNSIMSVGVFKETFTSITGSSGIGGIKSKLTDLATAAYIISLALDAEKFFSGATDFDEFLKSTGSKLAGLGAISGKPWVIAIGLTLAILGFGEEFQAIGRALQQKSQKAFSEGNWIGGIAQSFLASLTGTVGDAGVGLTEYANGLRDAGMAAEEESEVFMNTLKPALDDQSKTLDEISKQITSEYISSSDSRVIAIEKETKAIMAYTAALRERRDRERDGGFIGSLFSSNRALRSSSSNTRTYG